MPSSTDNVSTRGKRKERGDGARASEDSDDSGSDVSLINVSFDFTSFADTDYQAIKRLLTQLLYTSSDKFDLHALAELVLERGKQVGSTVKVADDGETGEVMDPFAFITLLDLAGGKGGPTPAPLSTLMTYLLGRVPASSALHTLLSSVSSPSSESPRLGLVLNERLINMPVQVVPPLYRLLGEEIKAETSEASNALPTHLVFLSRVFATHSVYLSGEEEDDDGDGGGRKAGGMAAAKKRRKQRQRKAAGAGGSGTTDKGAEMGLFHPEDEIIARFASHTHTFSYPPPKDTADDFDAYIFGRIMVVPFDKFNELSAAIEREVGQAVSAASGA